MSTGQLPPELPEGEELANTVLLVQLPYSSGFRLPGAKRLEIWKKLPEKDQPVHGLDFNVINLFGVRSTMRGDATVFPITVKGYRANNNNDKG